MVKSERKRVKKTPASAAAKKKRSAPIKKRVVKPKKRVATAKTLRGKYRQVFNGKAEESYRGGMTKSKLVQVGTRVVSKAKRKNALSNKKGLAELAKWRMAVKMAADELLKAGKIKKDEISIAPKKKSAHYKRAKSIQKTL